MERDFKRNSKLQDTHISDLLNLTISDFFFPTKNRKKQLFCDILIFLIKEWKNCSLVLLAKVPRRWQKLTHYMQKAQAGNCVYPTELFILFGL